MKVTVDERRVSAARVGNYILFEGIKAGSEIEAEFPLKQESFSFTSGETTYRCTFRGNDLLDISPRLEGASYPMYLGRPLEPGAAPLRSVTRYVTDRLLPW
jgi:hypothetical protein